MAEKRFVGALSAHALGPAHMNFAVLFAHANPQIIADRVPKSTASAMPPTTVQLLLSRR